MVLASLPQGQRTPDEMVELGRMLLEVNLLYLAASILILLDLSNQSRLCAARAVLGEM